jgi:glycerophosphoryl diester phosphodiesterase
VEPGNQDACGVDQTIALVNRYRPGTRILITSFWHPVIDDISRRTDVECGLLVAHRPNLKTVVWYWETVDADLSARSAACGLRNFVYGVTTPAEHQRLQTWNLDGVITDRPDVLRGH